MAVVGQFAGIETVAEHTFARGCNPERTVAVEVMSATILILLPSLLSWNSCWHFPLAVEEADSVLGGHYQLVLIRHDVADDVEGRVSGLSASMR